MRFNLKQVKMPAQLTQIVLSVTVNGRRIRVYSRLRVEPEFWDSERRRCHNSELLCPRVRKRLQGINASLDRIVAQIEKQDRILAERGCFLTQEDVRKAVLTATVRRPAKEGGSAISIMRQIAGNYQARLNRRGMIGEATTAATYLTAVRRLENFIARSGRKSVDFSDFDKGFFSEFAEYLTHYEFARGAEKMHYTANTVAVTLSIIRNILHRACDMELCESDCYSIIDASFPHEVADKLYLDEKEIGRIARVKVSGGLEKSVRDMFVIASYTGLRISDLNLLNNAVMGDGRIVTYQTKTKETVHIPILKEIAGLVADYGTNGFPVLQAGQANACIKELARRAGITDTVLISEIRGGVKRFLQVPKYSQVSFHTARRSCITNLYKRGYSANYLMSLSGHKSMASFQRYVKTDAGEMSREFIDELKKRKDIV